MSETEQTEVNKGGRPTLLNDDMKDKAREYIDGGWSHVNETHKISERVPSIAGLACWLKIARDTVYEWAKVDPEFSDIVEEVSASQELILTSEGLGGVFNSSITKLMLAKHGYADALRQEIMGKGGGPIESRTIDPSQLSSAALKELLDVRLRTEQ